MGAGLAYPAWAGGGYVRVRWPAPKRVRLLVGDRYGKDRVQWTRSFSNFARALDLYLALENAYLHFDHPDYDDQT